MIPLVTGQEVTFWVVAPLMVLGALGLLFFRKAVYAALSMAFVMVNLAVLYASLNAMFLTFVQIIVYTGAIMVLFVFVIMVLGAEKLPAGESRQEMAWQRPLALGLGVLLLIQAAYVVFTRVVSSSATKLIDSSPLAIGKALFGPYLFPFEVASILLLAAMVGAVVLTRKE